MSPEAQPTRPLGSLALFVLAGLTGGVLELLAQWARVLLLHRVLPFGRDYVWAIPVIEAIMGGIVGAMVVLAGLVIKPLARRDVVTALAAACAVLPVLWLYERVHPAASAVLALGMGSAVARVLGSRVILPYRILWVAAVMVGSVASLPAVWTFADIANGLMAVPNLVSLLALSGVAVAETREFLWSGDLDKAA